MFFDEAVIHVAKTIGLAKYQFPWNPSIVGFDFQGFQKLAHLIKCFVLTTASGCVGDGLWELRCSSGYEI